MYKYGAVPEEVCAQPALVTFRIVLVKRVCKCLAEDGAVMGVKKPSGKIGSTKANLILPTF